MAHNDVIIKWFRIIKKNDDIFNIIPSKSITHTSAVGHITRKRYGIFSIKDSTLSKVMVYLPLFYGLLFGFSVHCYDFDNHLSSLRYAKFLCIVVYSVLKLFHRKLTRNIHKTNICFLCVCMYVHVTMMDMRAVG